mmetsp:Transcript_10254/g.22745  ORF Transcript_10254/g.22745 Transcript_10254/m.22745 type:complete len:357 (-) Transcript_10254:2967-4037(-)
MQYKPPHHADFGAMQPRQICPNDVVHDLVEEEVLAVGREHVHHQVFELSQPDACCVALGCDAAHDFLRRDGPVHTPHEHLQHQPDQHHDNLSRGRHGARPDRLSLQKEVVEGREPEPVLPGVAVTSAQVRGAADRTLQRLEHRQSGGCIGSLRSLQRQDARYLAPLRLSRGGAGPGRRLAGNGVRSHLFAEGGIDISTHLLQLLRELLQQYLQGLHHCTSALHQEGHCLRQPPLPADGQALLQGVAVLVAVQELEHASGFESTQQLEIRQKMRREDRSERCAVLCSHTVLRHQRIQQRELHTQVHHGAVNYLTHALLQVRADDCFGALHVDLAELREHMRHLLAKPVALLLDFRCR